MFLIEGKEALETERQGFPFNSLDKLGTFFSVCNISNSWVHFDESIDLQHDVMVKKLSSSSIAKKS
jgi:hypothetical protein